jgi:hypothetical protein
MTEAGAAVMLAMITTMLSVLFFPIVRDVVKLIRKLISAKRREKNDVEIT